MADNRLAHVWLRRFAGLTALLGVLALSACGGGSGAPNNPFTPAPPALPALGVLPTTATLYSGVPIVLTINGGVAPFRAFSSNGTVLPVAQTIAGNSVVLLASDVAGDTPVTVTIQDAAGQTAPVTVTVKPAALLNTFSVTPNRNECGTTAICSGQTATASIVVQGPGGAPAAGRQVRFDVIAGPYSIVTTNPGQPSASSTSVVTDAAGVAQVIIRANVDAPTQPAELRATDLTSGQQRTANFMVVQNTNGATILTVVPGDATITGAFIGECSSGARVDYYIYGGTPPYRVTPSFPDAVSIVNPVVANAGGFFEAITNGTCVQPLTFSVLDATGRQTTNTLNNVPGTLTRPTPPVVPPTTLNVAPATQTGSCGGAAPVTGAPVSVTFSIVVTGGTPPYNVSVAPPPGGTAIVNTQPSSSNGFVSTVTVSGGGRPGTANVAVRDSSTPQQAAVSTIGCL
ncbi:MAG: hypothetical protein M3Z31_08015 [Pseudomonadota bacterium]|nr:hypothetical protein [Pseudomonadota bacterium]